MPEGAPDREEHLAANGRRRTKGSGSIVHRADGTWEFRREKHVSLDVSRSE